MELIARLPPARRARRGRRVGIRLRQRAARAAHDQLLQRDGGELQARVEGVGAHHFVNSVDENGCRAAELLPLKHVEAVAGDEGVDVGLAADDARGPPAQLVCRRVEQHAPLVDHDHVLEQVRDLVDQVGGEHDGARELGVVGEQTVVEGLPRDGVEAQVRLVEEGEGGAAREADDDPDGRELAAAQLLDAAVHRQAEVFDELVHELGVPVLEEPGGAAEDVLRLEVVRILLALLDEGDVLKHRGVLGGGAPEDPGLAARREVLPGEQVHEGGLARAVAAEQTGDRIGGHGDRDVVECRHGAESLRQVANLDHGIGAGGVREVGHFRS
jgi:hypothetical protein